MQNRDLGRINGCNDAMQCSDAERINAAMLKNKTAKLKQ
jgi:hypothetical protein